MRNTKKAISILLTLLMVVGMMSTFAFAQTVSVTGSDTGDATITINNASKGETYSIYKIFNAKITGTTGGAITYQKLNDSQVLPNGFEINGAGNIEAGTTVTDATVGDILKSYVKAENMTPVASVESTGSTLEFTGLSYGYYYITSTQGAAVTVTSTNKNATVNDKNGTTPGGDKYKKTVAAGEENVYIGQTVHYTVTYPTTNYIGNGASAKKVTKYQVSDNLPNFLSNVKLTSVKLYPAKDKNNKKYGSDGYTATGSAIFTSDELTNLNFGNSDGKTGTFDITWVDANGDSKYTNGSIIVIEYEAVVTDKIAIAGATGGKNEVTITPYAGAESGLAETNEITIKSYALAIKKVDEKGNALTGATFHLPKYKLVKSTTESVANGMNVYYVDGLAEGGTDFEVGANGIVLIKGIKAASDVEITEKVAPSGYNKLPGEIKVPVSLLTTTTTTVTIYKDAIGNVVNTERESTTHEEETLLSNVGASAYVVVNTTGSQLPSTGGIGTTIFYLIGAILVIGAGVVFVTRRRMHSDK